MVMGDGGSGIGGAHLSQRRAAEHRRHRARVQQLQLRDDRRAALPHDADREPSRRPRRSGEPERPLGHLRHGGVNGAVWRGTTFDKELRGSDRGGDPGSAASRCSTSGSCARRTSSWRTRSPARASTSCSSGWPFLTGVLHERGPARVLPPPTSRARAAGSARRRSPRPVLV